MGYRRRLRSGAVSFFGIIRITARNFSRNEVIKYCASLSFYTMFAIAPLLIVAIAIGSVIYGKDAINGLLFGQIHEAVGTDAAIAIQSMLAHTSVRKDNFLASLVGVVIFAIGATGVFAEIQSTINRIWGLKARPKKGLVRYLMSRVWSFVMVAGVGLLAVVSMLASSAVNMLQQELAPLIHDTTAIVWIANNAITLLIFTALFALIFKYLPDCIVAWTDALVGALFTATLFLAGKHVIEYYMVYSGTASAYGAAGALIVVLLWIYFSSVLLYFGAEFTLVYALNHGHGIRPNAFSVRVKYVEEEIREDARAIAGDEGKGKRDPGT